jgi:hypothetical protein
MGMMLRGNKLIGHDLKPDLLSIGINHADVDDTADYFCEVVPPVHSKAKAVIQKYSLKDVAQHLFPLINFQCGAHSAVSDARMTLKIWKKRKNLSNQILVNWFIFKKLIVLQKMHLNLKKMMYVRVKAHPRRNSSTDFQCI